MQNYVYINTYTIFMHTCIYAFMYLYCVYNNINMEQQSRKIKQLPINIFKNLVNKNEKLCVCAQISHALDLMETIIQTWIIMMDSASVVLASEPELMKTDHAIYGLSVLLEILWRVDMLAVYCTTYNNI